MPDTKQDERAKRERDRVKWNTLMEEIAKLKMQVRYTIPKIIITLLMCSRTGSSRPRSV